MEVSLLMPNELKKGSYGMFSGAGIPSSPSPYRSGSSSQQRRKRLRKGRKIARRQEDKEAEEEAVSMEKESEVAKRNKAVKREDSPLFEPDKMGERDVVMIDSDVDGGEGEESETEIGQSISRTSQRQLKRERTSITLSPSIRPPNQQTVSASTLESESETTITSTSKKPEMTQKESLTISSLSKIYSTSPSPGNATVLPAYREVLEKIAEKYVIQADYVTVMRSYDKEKLELMQAAAELPLEEVLRKQDITKVLAAVIQDDMSTSFSSTEALQQALNKRNLEAKEAEQRVEKEIKQSQQRLKGERERLAEKRRKFEKMNWDVEVQLIDLRDKKEELEKQGGMAMMFELWKEIAGEEERGERDEEG